MARAETRLASQICGPAWQGSNPGLCSLFAFLEFTRPLQVIKRGWAGEPPGDVFRDQKPGKSFTVLALTVVETFFFYIPASSKQPARGTKRGRPELISNRKNSKN